ncbi:HesA/MoeB/ThiF family protein [Tropicibacter naphthalenivorans]|uniref:Molybdopterin-synthase adenylyltransferase n=1 Tax=Tropicibacter naphthalenivorans TaxID=441103 RepID=A0A0P1GB43_9RHOB|nr:HesA/MoeB/ThiF family protein [Tropicibacter naphthalenivorans]CUH78669.1 putative adenylyltransferase/sulfurtransferase MoeZ [Tropicibacter naphthalenivorans]SMC81180.1 Molybdopterin or thiamine biosynthesis adenylyltransferase [Tropicibacter naphthalenivorans]
MGLVLGLCLLVYALGAVMRAPVRLRWGVICGILGVVVLAQLVLPEGNGLRVATGGRAAPWLILLGIAALVLLYRMGLGKLRNRAEQKEPPVTKPEGTFADGELDRYLRHIVLRELGGPGQKKLKQAKVLVIGAGGLGSPALLYLAAAGVGTIGVIDDDEVDVGNLQRQVIHRDQDIGEPKVFSAERAMKAVNPYLEVRPYQRRLTSDIAEDLIGDYDVVLDGTDNFDTRYLANRICVSQGKPLISGALSQWEGQVSVFDPAHGGPCYQCIFPEAPAEGLAPSCAEAGVLGPLPGVVGSMMAVEAVKQIIGAGAVLRGEMLIYDALWGETRKIGLKKRADCPVCG